MIPVYLAAPGTVMAMGLIAATTSTGDWIAPILSTGVVGIFLLMIVFRIRIMPTYVYDEARAEWDAERERITVQCDRELASLNRLHERETDAFNKQTGELKATIKEANEVYVSQVVPTLTRLLDSERELVALRRASTTRYRGGEEREK